MSAGWYRVAGTATSGPGLPAGPSGVTGVALNYRYTDPVSDGTPSGQGIRTLQLIVSVTPPTPLGGTLGGHVYIEYPDQSATDVFTLDGTTALDGTTTTAGNWAPTDAGKYPFNADGSPWIIPNLAVPAHDVNIRVYVVAYALNFDPAPVRATLGGASPNASILVVPPLTTASGAEYTQNVTNFQAIATHGLEGGVDVTHIGCTFTPPKDKRWGGVQIVLEHPSGTIQVLGVFTGSGTDSKFTTPAAAETDTIFAVSFSGKSAETGGARPSVNTLVPGVTPQAIVAVGTTLGTLNAGQAIPGSLGAALAVVGAVLTVPSQGINQALIADFAVSSQQLALAAVATANLQDLATTTAKLAAAAVTTSKVATANITTALIANAAVVTALIAGAQITTALIANAAITTALIANAAIGTAQIQNAAITTALIANAAITDALIANLSAVKITTGSLSGITASLNLNGITTTIDNVLDTGAADYVGLKVLNNTSGDYAAITAAQLFCKSGAAGPGGGGAQMGAIGGVGGYLQLGDGPGGSTHSILMTTHLGPMLKMDGNQVLAVRQTGPGNPSFALLADAQAWCQNLYNALKVGGHGLVT